MSRYSTIESHAESSHDGPLDGYVRLAATWAVTMSDDVRTIERVEWVGAKIERRDWNGSVIGSLKLSADELRELQPLIVQLLVDAEHLEFDNRPPEPEPEANEPVDPTQGQTFVVTDEQLRGPTSPGQPLDPSVLD